jgi:hypothetical protein
VHGGRVLKLSFYGDGNMCSFDIELEEKCWKCVNLAPYLQFSCTECKGTKVVPTRSGENLLEFMKKYGTNR